MRNWGAVGGMGGNVWRESIHNGVWGEWRLDTGGSAFGNPAFISHPKEGGGARGGEV